MGTEHGIRSDYSIHNLFSNLNFFIDLIDLIDLIDGYSCEGLTITVAIGPYS